MLRLNCIFQEIQAYFNMFKLQESVYFRIQKNLLSNALHIEVDSIDEKRKKS